MSWLFYYKIIFMTELLIAETMLVAHYPKRKGFAYLCPISLVASYALVIFFPEYLANGWISSSLMFLYFFALSLGCLMVCYKVKFVNILFCAIAAYTVQHISYVLFSLINVTLLDSQAFISYAYGTEEIALNQISGMTWFSLVLFLGLDVFVYFYSYFLLKNRIGKSGDLKFRSELVIFFIAFALSINIIISDIFRHLDLPTEAKTYIEIFYCIFSVLLCICLLCLQVAMIKTKDVENEMEILSHLYVEQQKHYQIRKDTIDLINIKCHDFRHQIRTIGANRGVDMDAVEEMQNIISLYDAEISTGNKSLDIILTEKNLLCKEKNIEFTCIVDGKLLSFIKDSDLYALFGNVLDNAIEAVDKVKDKTKRRVNFIVEQHQGAICIREDNYFVGNLFKDNEGNLYTTKDDQQYHGFGLKSIRSITETYDGILQLKTNKDIFQLSIVFFRIGEN